MLNFSARREAIEALEAAVSRHEVVRGRLTAASELLFKCRERAARVVVVLVEAYLSALAESPKDFEKTVADFRAEADGFTARVEQVKATAARSDKIARATGGTVTLAGVGVAALAPSTAIAVATTFGTASTGTAISALSGAAATNAALAWLGGGAIAVGGGGMAAGNALLALAGPVGWTIAGVALAGSAVYVHAKNGEAAREATEHRLEVEGEIRTLELAGQTVDATAEQTATFTQGVLAELAWLAENAPVAYGEFEEAHKQRLQVLINQVQSLSVLLRKEVSSE